MGRAGRDFTRVAALSDEIEIVGACSNPRFAGAELASLAEVDSPLPVVDPSLDEALARESDAPSLPRHRT